MFILIAILLAALLFYIFLILPTQWLKVERIAVPLGLNKKILQISDLHVEKLRISPEKIEEVIKNEKPDFIFLTGDFMIRRNSTSLLEPYLKVIQQSAIPTYAVLGNNDYLLRPVAICTDFLKEYNIPVLRNEWIELDDFVLIGIDDYCTHHHHINQSFKGVPKDKPSIVMTHDPNIIPDIDQHFELLLSGHLHGKQFNLPFLFYLTNKGPLAKQGIFKGLHVDNGRYFYISKGLGQSRLNLRFGVRSEVSVIHV